MDKLYSYINRDPFIVWTIDKALSNLCNTYGVEYEALFFQDLPSHIDIDTIPATNDRVGVFFFFEYNRRKEHFDALRRKCPNATCVQIGTDTQYNGYGDIGLVDYYIDLMEEYVFMSRQEGTPAELLWWTVSKDSVQHINKREKDNDLICLCREHCTQVRRQLFSKIRQKYSLVGDVKWKNLDQIIPYFERSRYTLGITHSPHDGNQTRGMKGFRDWLGPLCDSVLLYDDHPQMVKHFSGIIPFYKYNDPHSLFDLMSMDNQVYLQKQKDWISENFLENQFEEIFLKWGLL